MEAVQIPLAPFKKGGTCSPFHEGGWGDFDHHLLVNKRINNLKTLD